MPNWKSMPVDSFGAKLMSVLLNAAPPPGHQIRGEYKRLYNLQLRLNMLRRAMKREGHPEWDRAIKVKVSLERDSLDPTQATLTIGLRDAEFDDLLDGLVPVDDSRPASPSDEEAQLDATLEALLNPKEDTDGE